MRASSLAILLGSALLVPSVGVAQETPDINEARARSARALDCMERVLAQLQSTIRLLRESQAQLNASSGQARTDAARAVVTLEQRVDDLGEQLRGCVPRQARLEVETQVQPHTGAEARVAQDNPATHELERNRRLTSNVQVVVGERVDGHGRLDGGHVRSMMSGIASRLDQCYGELVDRGALQTGTVIFAFTVRSSGRVTRIRVENSSISNQRFQRCLFQAGGRLRAPASPRGGDVRFAYTLRFGPQ